MQSRSDTPDLCLILVSQQDEINSLNRLALCLQAVRRESSVQRVRSGSGALADTSVRGGGLAHTSRRRKPSCSKWWSVVSASMRLRWRISTKLAASQGEYVLSGRAWSSANASRKKASPSQTVSMSGLSSKSATKRQHSFTGQPPRLSKRHELGKDVTVGQSRTGLPVRNNSLGVKDLSSMVQGQQPGRVEEHQVSPG